TDEVEIKNREVSAIDECINLDDVILTRISQLPKEAQKFLEILAVAGQPLERVVAKRAAGLESEEQEMLVLLRAGHMIRTTGMSDQGKIETYHDRIRETIVAHL